MKRLTIEITLLILILALIFSAFEWSYRNKLSPYDYVFRNLEQQEDSITQISIGNSHTGALLQNGLSDSDFVFNLGLGGQDLFHIMAVLNKTVPDCPKLKTVLLGLDYDLLGYNFAMEKQVWKDRQYYPYTGVLYDSSRMNYMAAKSSFLRLNRDLRYLFTSTNNQLQTKKTAENFIPLDAAGITESGAKSRAIEHSITKFNEALIPANLQYLERIILLCRQFNIQLVIINSPKTHWYTQYYNQEVKFLAERKTDSMLEKYHLVYHDFFNDKRFNDQDFLDTDHLNMEGGAKLMRLLKSDLNGTQSY